MVHNLSRHQSILNRYILEVRDKEIQKDPMRFRRNVERIGEILAYEISKSLYYQEKLVETPLAETSAYDLNEEPVLATILRAGIPMHQGFLNVFDRAENAFVSAYRRFHKGGDFEIEVEYMSSVVLEGKTLILIDPMLATGASMLLVYQSLLRFGKPKKVHLVSAIASKQGIKHIQSRIDTDVEIWTGAIDDELTAQGYIVPGLGDAGDLSFGKKK